MKVYINQEEENIIYITTDKPDWSGLKLTEIDDDLYAHYKKCDREYRKMQTELEQYLLYE
uniref:Uncharacterized protein n=1 Tax=viral metagenome TaxID=1070528 RepID=A0A6M3ISK4_9ZZZZ